MQTNDHRAAAEQDLLKEPQEQAVAQHEQAAAAEAPEEADVDVNINEFFDSFTTNQEQEIGEWTYFGFGMDWQNPQVRLAILDAENGLIFIPVSDIGRVIAKPEGDAILMVCHDYQVEVKGENLLPIMEPLQNNYLSFLEVYDAERYAPPEEGEVVITEIELVNQ